MLCRPIAVDQMSVDQLSWYQNLIASLTAWFSDWKPIYWLTEEFTGWSDFL